MGHLTRLVGSDFTPSVYCLVIHFHQRSLVHFREIIAPGYHPDDRSHHEQSTQFRSLPAVEKIYDKLSFS